LGCLPLDWRTGNIVATFKNGNKCDPSNYRPVSLTCVICKVMESIIRDVYTDYFLLNGFFSNKQYGFIKGRSTVLQLLKLMDGQTDGQNYDSQDRASIASRGNKNSVARPMLYIV